MVLPKGKFFAAIEVKANETPHQAIGSLMRLAKSKNILFAALEVFDTLTVSRIPFVRFRTDMDVKALKEDILQAGRGIILRGKSIPYEVTLTSGPKGNYPASAMHMAARRPEYRAYRGTKDMFWERQFP